MKSNVWSTRDARPAEFDEAWRTCLRVSGHAHFALEADYLEWEAHRGQHSQALLLETNERRAAVVLREAPLGWDSGWPWRWQVAIASPAQTGVGISDAASRWLFREMANLRDWRRLAIHLPAPPPGGVNAKRAGSTIVLPLDGGEEALLKRMSGNKRREVKKAAAAGFEVVEATTRDEFTAFQALQLDAEARRTPASRKRAVVPQAPPFGEAWREWELPWMWLLVAKREGRVVAGSGFGRSEGGMLDYRTNASTDDARQGAANTLLAWEAMRRGAAAGYRFMNWGGATTFKRGLGGERVETWCWLGGGGAWALPNLIAAGIDRAKPKVAASVRRAGRDLGKAKRRPPRP